MAKPNLHSFLTLVLLAALAAIGYLWFTGKLVPRTQVAKENLQATSGLLKTESQFRDKLAELRMQRDKVKRGVKRLDKLKGETVEHLKTKGINSGADYLTSKDPDVKYAVVNLKGWVAQIDKINKEVAYYDEAISSIEVMLDKIERERINESVSLSEDEYLDLQKIIVDLNERLEVETNILEDEELGKLLDLEMAGSSNQSATAQSPKE